MLLNQIGYIAKLLQRKLAGALLKYERQKLQRLQTQCGVAYGSVRNLVIASGPPVSEVRQFLKSKSYFTKITLTRREFRRTKAVARFKK